VSKAFNKNKASPHAIPMPAGWPVDKPVALAVSILLEGWPQDVAPEGGPSTAQLNKGFADTAAQSWVSYGPKVGAWRILDVLDAAQAKAVFYASGILTEQYLDLLKEIVARGHVIAAHGWAQNILPIYLDEGQEQAYLAKIGDGIESLCGARPVGYASPRGTPSQNTVELLTRNGFVWTADFRDHDLPYVKQTASGPLVCMPWSSDINDMPLIVKFGNEPEQMPRSVKRMLSLWPEVGSWPVCQPISAHAHVFGRPAGALEFLETLRAVQDCQWAWLTNHFELARLYI
jgi:hypothetical protein